MPPIHDFLRDVHSKSANCRSEEEFRFLFLSELASLSRNLGIDATLRLEEAVQTGHADARVGAIVYEFKKPYRLDDPATRREALDEIYRYLNDYSKKGDLRPNQWQGFVTDGKLAALVAFIETKNGYGTVDPYERPIDESNAFIPLGDTDIWLERTLRSLERRELSPDNLLEDFGPGTSLCQRLARALWDHLESRRSERKVSAFYGQWKILFSEATKKVVSGKDLASLLGQYGLEAGSVKEDEQVRSFLFVVQTYYSLILKLLAVRIADELQLLGPISLLKSVVEDSQSGLAQAEENLPKLAANFVERDVFSWLDHQPTKLKVGISEMARRMERYDVHGVRRDVLKRVYQGVIPSKLRKALGEFYTKDWVAELVLDEVGYKGEGSILDPSCGSGTFLAVAIQRRKTYLAKVAPDEALKTILSSVVGFDVNPIAVITSRVNYLLAILDLLRASRLARGLRIPVYLCDSVVIPEELPDISTGTGKSYLLQTAVGELRIPPLPKPPMGEQPEHKILQILEAYAERTATEFLDEVRDSIGPDYELSFRPLLRQLHKKVAELERDGVNGIWARFVENFFAPLFLTRFDYVVGNPPWVAPVHVPKEYRDNVQKLVIESGYQEKYELNFRTAKARFRAAEEAYVACLPFMYRALKRYVKDGGKIAFLLTSSLIRSLNAGGWRQRVLERDLEKIVDLTLITDIHEGALCWAFIPVVANRAGATDSSIDYTYVTRKERVQPVKKKDKHPEDAPELVKHSWTVNRSSLRFTTDERSPWFVGPVKVKKLLESLQSQPRLGDFYTINMGVKPDAIGVYYLARVERANGHVTGYLTGGEKVLLEAELVYPLVKGENIRAWHFEHSHLLVPHDPRTWKPFPELVMKNRFPESYEFLTEHRKELEDRALYAGGNKPKDKNRQETIGRAPFYTIFEISTNKIGENKVAYVKHATHLEACVIPKKVLTETVGDKPKDVMLDTSAYFLNIESIEECNYVAGLLNSTPLRTFAYSLAEPKGGAPYRQFFQWTVGMLPVPRFMAGNRNHLSIASLSKQAQEASLSSERTDAIVEIESEIDEKVSELYGLTERDLVELRDHLSLLQGRPGHTPI